MVTLRRSLTAPPPVSGRRHWLGAASGLALSALAPWPGRVAAQPMAETGGRLLATAADWQRLRERIAVEPDLALYHAALLGEARRLQREPLPQRQLVGRRLLATSQRVLHRAMIWGYAVRTTGDGQWARVAEPHLLATAAMADWNPSHYLDVAEATAALALALDWLGPWLPEPVQAELQQAIVRHGISPALDTRARHFWQRAENNWNQVCWGGLVLGALAVQAVAPEPAARLLALARTHIVHGVKPYAPDGVYPEGPSYWAYGTTYQVLMMAGLQSATGDDWGLQRAPGFMASAQALLHTLGPGGRPFNFADGGETATFSPVLFWFAHQLGDPGLLLFERRRLGTATDCAAAVRGHRFATLAALWWPAPGPAAVPRADTDWTGGGEQPLLVWRDGWDDPKARYLAAKGGSAWVNHAHMDAGSFVLDWGGARWVVDPGLQEYESLESRKVDLWNRAQDSQRWQVFRLGPRAHATVQLDDELHRVKGMARVRSGPRASGLRAGEIDLSEVLGLAPGQWLRRFDIDTDAVRVSDRATGLRPGTAVRWQIPTRAAVEVQGATAVLRQSGLALEVQWLDAPDARFEVESAAQPQPAFNAPNPGLSLLVARRVVPPSGALAIQVRLQLT